MSRRTVRACCMGIVLIVLGADSGLFPSPLAAEKQQPSAKSNSTHPRTGQEAIEAALATPTKWEFYETPLSEVINYLEDQHRIEIELDKVALDEAGIALSSPITRTSIDLKFEHALDLLLRELNLTWTIKSDVLLITTPEVAESLTQTKVYDVRDLVAARDEQGQLWDDYDTLERLVTDHVDSHSWMTSGGAGTVTGVSVGSAKSLVVTQTYHAHKKIESLLKDLRQLAAQTKGDGNPPLRPRPQKSIQQIMRERRGGDVNMDPFGPAEK